MAVNWSRIVGISRADLRDWWRRQSVGQKTATAVFWLLIALGLVAALAGLLALVADIAQRWQEGTLIDAVLRETRRYQALLWILAGLVALVVLWFVVTVAWAWIMLPFTLQAGVAAVERLRLEVAHLREQLPARPNDLDDDLDD